ncbi:MAG TPA: hypothetical protein VHE33_15045 [Acidobacteriaceae bacterium]|nr:hypothetical protein [Acidobacteriaceae bacterium]
MKICKSFAVLAFLFAAVTAFADPTVASPANGSTVSSPFNLSASASSCSSHSISAMGYSFDNSPSTTFVYSNSFSASVAASAGAHVLHVKSWGVGGGGCVTDVAITVSGTTPPAATSPDVAVSSPGAGASVYSPFTLIASSPTCQGHSTAAMGYSFDNSPNTAIFYGTAMNGPVSAANGAHVLHVKAWGNGGGACNTDVPINVTAPANAAVLPSSAISVSNIHNLSNWTQSNDSGAMGWSTGAQGLVGSPSRSGSAREFVTSFSNNGNERYWVSFGDDNVSTNFLYDTWVYVQSPNTQLANIEMDMNQTMPNGQTAIFGFQCDGWNGTWDYTKNAGTPQAPVDTWVKSNQHCNPREWSVNTWHHVQVAYSRDNSGNINYQTVWLDDVPQPINVTVNSAFALGWAPSLLTNFQVDGIGDGQAIVFMDNLTVYRW